MELVAVLFYTPAAILALGWLQSSIIIAGLLAVTILCTAEPDDFVGMYALVLLATFGLIGYSFHAPLWAYITSPSSFWFLVEYISIGALYMVFRWWSLNREMARKVAENKQILLEEFQNSITTATTFGEWLEYRNYLPVVSNNKYRLFNWWFVWPFSLVHWATTDMVRHIANALVDLLGNSFNRIRNHVFKSFGVDISIERELKHPVEKERNL